MGGLCSTRRLAVYQSQKRLDGPKYSTASSETKVTIKCLVQRSRALFSRNVAHL